MNWWNVNIHHVSAWMRAYLVSGHDAGSLNREGILKQTLSVSCNTSLQALSGLYAPSVYGPVTKKDYQKSVREHTVICIIYYDRIPNFKALFFFLNRYLLFYCSTPIEYICCLCLQSGGRNALCVCGWELCAGQSLGLSGTTEYKKSVRGLNQSLVQSYLHVPCVCPTFSLWCGFDTRVWGMILAAYTLLEDRSVIS